MWVERINENSDYKAFYPWVYSVWSQTLKGPFIWPFWEVLRLVSKHSSVKSLRKLEGQVGPQVMFPPREDTCVFPHWCWILLCSFQGISAPLLQVVWARIILDEAHNVKNPRVQTSIAVCKLQAQARWAVTGTPIQNNLLDMYSLMKWVSH